MKRAVCASLLGLLPGSALALQWNMPEGVTEISREVYGLHMLIFGICVVIGIGVFGVMFYSVFKHRKSLGAKPANFHESTTVEIVWTLIPFLILIGMAIPAAGTLIKMEDASNAEMTVKITGYQWMWEYEYLDSGIHFYSRLDADSDRARQTGAGVDVSAVDNYLLEVDNRVVLPVGKKIRFLLTANDVLHAWWVPDLAVKKDAVPGFVREMWTKIDEPGVYRGQCAELCGRDHGFMPIVVEALPQDEYDQWVAAQTGGATTDVPADSAAATAEPTEVAMADAAAAEADAEPAGDLSQDALMTAGEKVYKSNCTVCHKDAGTGMPPAFPSLVGSPVVTGDPATQIAQIISGKNAMPPFGHLSDQDIAAVVTYTRNSWGNDTGVVQPADVAAQR
ncbi:cytochrome c oxidase subunit II [Abyssibacter profundi]|uniref:Cytochrome c oxidase subunit 2 n=1 Tax=Abyssibacter profundi TaxID=2182787 RepID=A0A363ULS2_9GAMM|nr:cytochrome c oxidase subunit II [Abyssibacter profundi]MBV62509.1 cytochrome c oxidase subunit II [Nevskiales bacterium]PWN56378.1 cytochrome c oxidase subunit II [Abyssibacter profundi]